MPSKREHPRSAARRRHRACGLRLPVRLWTCGVLAACMGCAPSTGAESSRPVATADDALVQYSLITALAAGDYAGGVPLPSMLADGDFGIGTFDHLEGELILLEGKVFQALADQSVKEADLKRSTPFAVVTFFNVDGRMEGMSAATLPHLDELLDEQLPRRNAPYAIRIDGRFEQVALRSVPQRGKER